MMREQRKTILAQLGYFKEFNDNYKLYCINHKNNKCQFKNHQKTPHFFGEFF